MGTAVADRWTCPGCQETVAPRVPLAQVHEVIRQAQLEHARAHARGDVPVEVRVPQPPPRVEPNAAAAPPVRPAAAPARAPLTPIWVA